MKVNFATFANRGNKKRNKWFDFIWMEREELAVGSKNEGGGQQRL